LQGSFTQLRFKWGGGGGSRKTSAFLGSGKKKAGRGESLGKKRKKKGPLFVATKSGEVRLWDSGE